MARKKEPALDINALVDNEEVVENNVSDELTDSMLSYAVMTVVDRALPDIADGLKPVNRRILYGSEVAGYNSNKQFVKCARIDGDVVGRFHPHGSVYGTIANMSQPWTYRYPLMDFHGCNGGIDSSDAPAASRYCVTGDTLIATNNGLQRIEDIAVDAPESKTGAEIELEINSIKGVRKADRFFNSGRHKTIRIKNELGMTLQGSYNHPILIYRNGKSEWRTLQDIQIGDNTIIDTRKYKVGSNRQFVELWEAELIGAVIATCNKEKNKLVFRSVNAQYIDTLKNNLSKFCKKYKVNCDIQVAFGDYDTTVKYANKEYFELIVSNQSIIDKLRLYYELDLSAPNCNVPDCILQSDADIHIAFLKNLLQHGAVLYKGKNARMELRIENNCKILPVVQIMLLQYGIVAKLSDNNDTLSIVGNNSLYSLRNINIIIPNVKKEEFDGLYGKGFVLAPITQKDKADTEYVYTIRVDDETHSYIANGYINHNTESKLTKLAEEYMLEDTKEKQSVEFVPNYSETDVEPIELPALFPNFLANGANGIAVGYTTDIPSHNLNELCDMIAYAIKHENYTLEDLMKYLHGPDFPYGSLMLSDGIKELYARGEGKLQFRAQYKQEINEENGNPQIVFFDMPPQSDKIKIVEKIRKLVSDKMLPRVVAVRDESKGMDIRITVECNKNANIPLIVADIYAKTGLQANHTFYLRGIYNKELLTINLCDYVQIYLEHQYAVIENRMAYMLNVAENKLNIQLGLSKVIKDIKKAINVIMDADTTEIAKKQLMDLYELNETQADYILDKKVRSLIKMERDKIFELISELQDQIKYCNNILHDKVARDNYLLERIDKMQKQYGDARRTVIVDKFSTEESALTDTEVMLVLCDNGTFKCYDENEFEQYVAKQQYRDRQTNFVLWNKCKLSDTVCVFDSVGKMTTYSVKQLQCATTKINDAKYYVRCDEKSDKVLVSICKNGAMKKTCINKLKRKSAELIKGNTEPIVKYMIAEDKDNMAVTLATHEGNIGRFSITSSVATGVGAQAVPTNNLAPTDYIVDARITDKQLDAENKLLLICNTTSGVQVMKVMALAELLVKGRKSKPLTCAEGKYFAELLQIDIAKDTFVIYDTANRVLKISDYVISNRAKKIPKTDTIALTRDC